MTTFSLIITTYNSEKYVERAIHCALNQTRKADEIIICDDNSSDNTLSICKKFEKYLKIIVNPNGPSGLCKAFNFALTQGSFDYTTILHYDDLLSEDYLYQVEKALNSYPDCKFLYVGCDYIDQNDNVIIDYHSVPNRTPIVKTGKEYTLAYLNGVKSNKHIHRCPGVVFHKELISKDLRFRNEAGIILDDDLFYRVGQYTCVIGIEFPLAHVRHHPESETGAMTLVKFHSDLAVDYKFLIDDWDKTALTGINGIKQFYHFVYINIIRSIYYGILSGNHNYIKGMLEIQAAVKSKYPIMYRVNKKIKYEVVLKLTSYNAFRVLKIFFLAYRLIRN